MQETNAMRCAIRTGVWIERRARGGREEAAGGPGGGREAAGVPTPGGAPPQQIQFREGEVLGGYQHGQPHQILIQRTHTECHLQLKPSSKFQTYLTVATRILVLPGQRLFRANTGWLDHISGEERVQVEVLHEQNERKTPVVVYKERMLWQGFTQDDWDLLLRFKKVTNTASYALGVNHATDRLFEISNRNDNVIGVNRANQHADASASAASSSSSPSSSLSLRHRASNEVDEAARNGENGLD